MKEKSTFVCRVWLNSPPKYLGAVPTILRSSLKKRLRWEKCPCQFDGVKSLKPTKLKEVSSINYARIKTDMDEFNRV